VIGLQQGGWGLFEAFQHISIDRYLYLFKNPKSCQGLELCRHPSLFADLFFAGSPHE
jgi:hypothetical protein